MERERQADSAKSEVEAKDRPKSFAEQEREREHDALRKAIEPFQDNLNAEQKEHHFGYCWGLKEEGLPVVEHAQSAARIIQSGRQVGAELRDLTGRARNAELDRQLKATHQTRQKAQAKEKARAELKADWKRETENLTQSSAIDTKPKEKEPDPRREMTDARAARLQRELSREANDLTRPRSVTAARPRDRERGGSSGGGREM
jgi:hypothetical protein